MTGVSEGLLNGHVWSIAQKPDGEVLLGTTSGIIRWNNGVAGHIFLPGPFSPTVNSIAGSLSDELWVASTAGLAKLEQGEWSHFSFSNPLLGGDFAVNSVCVDHNGIVWAGTQGAGVYKFDGLTWVNITAMEGLPSNTIYDIMEDHNGNIWFGTVSGACIYNGSGFSYLTTLDGLVGSNVHCIFEDSGNRIWMGTCSGVSCWNGVSFANYNMSDGLPSNYINAIVEDNGMWFGTNSGLSRKDFSGFTNFTTSDGLTSNTVMDIAVAGPGVLFLANELGYNVGYPSTGWITGTNPTGLNSFYAAWKADNGDVWMGGYLGGIIRFSDIVSGISQEKIPDQFLGWPNPATTDFYLAVPDSYVLYDSFGNIVRHSVSISETIPLADLPAGIYYVRTSDGNQRIIKF
jgi:ligand-binding sensor domain-containing protein